jgi:4-hydroxy-tetrahydrodipicolinate synthase
MPATSTSGRFGAVVTAMVTPFTEDGRLDIDGAVALAGHLAATGTDALVVAGTTGEAPVLSDSEKLQLWRAIAESSDLPVIAGAGTYDTAHSIELVRKAAAAGVDGILLVTPYYNRPPQAGIEAHFRAIASATELPVMLYDIPIRTGRRIAPEMIVRLAHDVDNIVALKDAAGDVAGTSRLAAELPEGFVVYSGDDVLTLPFLAVGAVGIVSVASHWAGRELAEMIAAYQAGEVDLARRINIALLPSYAYETGDEAPNPLPAKAMMRLMGLPAGHCRLPLGDAPSGLEERAKQVLADLDAWRESRAS